LGLTYVFSFFFSFFFFPKDWIGFFIFKKQGRIRVIFPHYFLLFIVLVFSPFFFFKLRVRYYTLVFGLAIANVRNVRKKNG